MQVIESLTAQIKAQVQMLIKDFSMLEQLDKQLQILMKKELQGPSELNDVFQLSAKILDIYYILEEEYEMELYKTNEENNSMEIESDSVALDFSFKAGNIAISFINFCFKNSLKCNDMEQRFSKSQLEDLLTININYIRKLLDMKKTKGNEGFLQQTCLINSLILDLIRDQLEENQNLQGLNFCNQYNLLEIYSLNPKANLEEVLQQCKTIQNSLDIYPQLSSCKKNIIENMLCILFEQVSDCSSKKIEELLKMIDSTPSLLQFSGDNYKQHILNLRLINAIDQKDSSKVDKYEKQIEMLNLNDQGNNIFMIILKIRKLNINSDSKSIEKTVQILEDYFMKNSQISQDDIIQILSEITRLDIKLFYLCFTVFQQYINYQKNQLIQDNKLQKKFSEILTVFCTVIDEYFGKKDWKYHLEITLESLKACLKQIIAILLTVKKFTIQDINSFQIFYSRICKIILEIGINLKDIKDKQVNEAIDLIEVFILLLKKQQKDNAQHQLFIDEISCLGLIFAIKVNNKDFIKEFSRNIQDSFSFLPQVLMATIKKEEISNQEFSKLLNQLIRQNGQNGKSGNNIQNPNQNLIYLFAFKNLIFQMENYEALLQFYISFVDQNFEEYFQFFRQNFIENYLDKPADISLCTPFVKKIASLKNNVGQNIGEIQEGTKMIFSIIERFYQYYSTTDQDIPLNILITDKERNELIELMQIYFQDASVSSDPRVSCKLLHYVILYSCLDVVFDNENSDYSEKNYLNQCIFKLNYKLNIQNNNNNNNNNGSQPKDRQQSHLFMNPYFLRSLILLYSYQITFYEITTKQTTLPKSSVETLENLIESYEVTIMNLLEYLKKTNQTSVKESLKNQFFLFQFIFSLLQNNVTKSLSVIETFLEQFPDQLVLLSQICKALQKQDLVLIINKKYIYYLSSKNYQVEQFSHVIESQNDNNQIESSYLPVKMIIEKVLSSDAIQESQIEIILYIIRELVFKLSKSNTGKQYILELQNLEQKIKNSLH